MTLQDFPGPVGTLDKVCDGWMDRQMKGRADIPKK